MAGDTTHPVCGTCGERIGVYEPIWLKHADGTLTATSLLNLDEELQSDSHQAFFHLGCLAPDQIPHTKVARPVRTQQGLDSSEFEL